MILPLPVNVVGLLFLLMETLLHIWTGELLGIGIIGVPEVKGNAKSILITDGPFSYVRHPTYLAHTMIFLGIFLISGAAAVGIVTIIDFVIINVFTMPLEEKELLERFGEEYGSYMRKVPRFFPQ